MDEKYVGKAEYFYLFPNGKNWELKVSHLWRKSGSLFEQGASNEPEGVGNGELVLHDVWFRVAWVGIVPLVRRKPGHDEHGEAHQDVGSHDVEPDLDGQRVHEREQSRGLTRRQLCGNLDVNTESPRPDSMQIGGRVDMRIERKMHADHHTRTQIVEAQVQEKYAGRSQQRKHGCMVVVEIAATG